MVTHSRTAYWFNRIEKYELPICIFFNRASSFRPVNSLFKLVSRLGDGVFWYCLIAALVVFLGKPAVLSALHILITGCAGVIIYKLLKERLVRERPYITHNLIFCNTRPLDRYSFPSGHTLHAVNFSVMLVFYYPELTWLVFPFAILVALSRFILGLHYVSDVVVGGLIGATLAAFSLQLQPFII